MRVSADPHLGSSIIAEGHVRGQSFWEVGTLATGLIETVLGTGERGDGPDGDPMQCQLARPHGLFAHEGVLYVTDSENHRVRALEGAL